MIFSILVLSAFFVEKWLFATWAELTAEEILYHLKAPLSGTDSGMVLQAVVRYGFPLLLTIAVLVGLTIVLRKKKRLRSFFVIAVLVLDFALIVFLKYDLDTRIGFTSFITGYLKGDNSTFIEQNYVDPHQISVSFPEKKRNLIYIFLESMETTYSDEKNGGAFPKDIIPELTALAQNNEDFSGSGNSLNGGISLPGATWTMGAMFAQATGLPLKVPVGSSDMKNQDAFYPDVASLGTILEEEGYQQELLLGSDAVFGGREVFYQSHGNFQIHDYHYAVENEWIPSDYKVFWGYEDHKLFEFAKEDLKALADKDQPFNLTLLTVDTHFEDGYVCDLCGNDFGEQYADVMACSSRQVADFVRWIQDQDFYKDTTIVICGDHPTMDKDFCDGVPDSYQRKVYVSVINPAATVKNPEKSRVYSTFDLFPTTLSAMGVSIPGDKLGLGTDLFSDQDTLLEEYGLDTCQIELERPSRFMDEMSNVRLTEDDLDRMKKKLTISVKVNEDGSKAKVVLKKIHKFINRLIISKAELELKDKMTGETEKYDLQMIYPDENHKAVYYLGTDIHLHGKNPDDYEGIIYLTIDGVCDHYPIADFETNIKNK